MSFLVCNHLAEEERAGYFTLIAFQMSCDCQCSVTLSHGAVGWSTGTSHKLLEKNEDVSLKIKKVYTGLFFLILRVCD